MLGKSFRRGTTPGVHFDSNASGVSLQLCIPFTQLRPLTGDRSCLDLNAQLQAVPVGQALRGRVLFATFYHHP